MDFNKVISLLLLTNSWKATKYISPKEVLRVTRRRYLHSSKSFVSHIELVINVGRPNYAEKEFIKKLVKTKVPFPVKKIQLKAIPKRKK